MAIPESRLARSIKDLTDIACIEQALRVYDELFDEIRGPDRFFEEWTRETDGKEHRFEVTPHYPLYYRFSPDPNRAYPSAAIAAVANYFQHGLLWDANHAGEGTHVKHIRDVIDPGESIVRFHQRYEDLDIDDDEHEQQIQSNNGIPETEKQQLIIARRGQGVFKTRLCKIEKRCRITGVDFVQHLRASHIKPWRDSTPFEKLDGNNGLLLSPHIDHLFDRGYISFAPSGEFLVSSQVSGDLLKAWDIDPSLNVWAFKEEQAVYLEYHNDYVFKS